MYGARSSSVYLSTKPMNAEQSDAIREVPANPPVLVCERCGRPDGIAIRGRQLCEECCQIAGSCCMEFGGDDLWQDGDD